MKDIGARRGKHYSVNVPLKDGINDKAYKSIFEPVIEQVMEQFKPTAVVLQCGSDSITGDRLGCFNLTVRGHAECVRYVMGFGLPTLVLGGGGYTIRNVARCWTYETAVVLNQVPAWSRRGAHIDRSRRRESRARRAHGARCSEAELRRRPTPAPPTTHARARGPARTQELEDDLPPNDYYEYFVPDWKLHLQPNPTMDNLNSRQYLEGIKSQVLENLRALQGAPSVQMAQMPPALQSDDEAGPDEADPEQRPDDPHRHAAESFAGENDQG